MRISVIGTGYVGLVSGVCFAELGHQCMCVDIDATKVARIKRGESPIYEADLPEMMRRLVGVRLDATTDLRRAVLDSDITFIAVGTPFDGKTIDLRFVREAARQIGAALREKNEYHVVVVKSTVVPGTTDGVVAQELERASGKQAGVAFGLGMNPEFLTEGVAIADFMKPDRIVIGGIDARTIAMQRKVYSAFGETPIIETNNKTAEMIKYTSNAVLATLISFSNEIANLCTALGGVDAADVLRGVHLARYFTTVLDDGRRINAPISSFLWAGCGYGGSCLPKDTQALSAHAAAHGASMPVLDAVIRVNAGQPMRVIDLLRRNFSSIAGLRVAVLGLAFKEGTDDVRESPAIPIIRRLVERGVRCVAYDPVARDSARPFVPEDVAYAATLQEALTGADVVLLLTRWPEFQDLPALLEANREPPLVIDGRRMLDRTAVPRYDGIGL